MLLYRNSTNFAKINTTETNQNFQNRQERKLTNKNNHYYKSC